jgi:hypothetical protein
MAYLANPLKDTDSKFLDRGCLSIFQGLFCVPNIFFPVTLDKERIELCEKRIIKAHLFSFLHQGMSIEKYKSLLPQKQFTHYKNKYEFYYRNLQQIPKSFERLIGRSQIKILEKTKDVLLIRV